MNRLWAPWRETYITKLMPKQKSCVFCRILAAHKDKRHLIFIRKPHAYAVLNIYPYSNGHCLIVPNRHVGDISKLSARRVRRADGTFKGDQGPFANGIGTSGF